MKLAIFSIIVLLVFNCSCSSHKYYTNYKNERTKVIYFDDYITITRSNEVYSNKLIISYYVKLHSTYDTLKFDINNIDCEINTLERFSGVEFSKLCNVNKREWFPAFNKVPSKWRNLIECNQFQLFSTYSIKSLPKRFVIIDKLSIIKNYKIVELNNIDTLIKNSTLYIPNP